jgi:hypothetical protein
MLIESLAGLGAVRLGLFALSFRSAVGKPPFGGAALGFIARCTFARDPQIDDFRHWLCPLVVRSLAASMLARSRYTILAQLRRYGGEDRT